MWRRLNLLLLVWISLGNAMKLPISPPDSPISLFKIPGLSAAESAIRDVRMSEVQDLTPRPPLSPNVHLPSVTETMMKELPLQAIDDMLARLPFKDAYALAEKISKVRGQLILPSLQVPPRPYHPPSNTKLADLPLPVIDSIMSRLSFRDASALANLLSENGVKVNPYEFFNPALGGRYFVREFEKNNVEAFEGLVKNRRWNPSWDDNLLIRWAAKNRHHVDSVKKLLDDRRVDPSAHDNEAIRLAARNGNTRIVKLLLNHPKVDPSARDYEAIITAAKNGYTNMLEILLKDTRVNPAVSLNDALERAATQGHTEAVKLLLKDPRVTPYEKHLVYAAYNGHSETVKLLLQDPRISQKNTYRKGFYALEAAYKQGHAETLKVLLRDPTFNVYDPDFYMSEAYDIMNRLGPHRSWIFFYYSKQVLKAYVDRLRLEQGTIEKVTHS